MKIHFIQKFIDLLRRKHKSSYSNHLKELAKKILSFEKIKEQIDTIIIGSSHAQLGYRAKNNEFNLGLSFQDLYYGYHLYNKYVSSKIKNVILFYSVFSPGNQTIMTNFSDVASIYKIVCNIDYQDKKIAKQKKLKQMEAGFKSLYKKIKKSFDIDYEYRGNETSYITCFKPPKASQRALQHLKNNQRNNNQTQYVKKIYDLAIKNNSKLLVVISPATKAYKDSLPSSDVLFKDLIDLIQKHNINFLNMYDTSIFDNNDFEDWDHLNIKGAEKLTQIITHELQYISNKK